MKCFLLFSYDDYYPGGGWSDLDSMHDTLEGAKAAAESRKFHADNYEIVDLNTAKVVLEAYFPYTSLDRTFNWKAPKGEE